MAVTKWEHRFEEVGRTESISEVLARMGKEGWEPWHIASLSVPPGLAEAISGTYRTIYFKRPVQEYMEPQRQ